MIILLVVLLYECVGIVWHEPVSVPPDLKSPGILSYADLSTTTGLDHGSETESNRASPDKVLQGEPWTSSRFDGSLGGVPAADVAFPKEQSNDDKSTTCGLFGSLGNVTDSATSENLLRGDLLTRSGPGGSIGGVPEEDAAQSPSVQSVPSGSSKTTRSATRMVEDFWLHEDDRKLMGTFVSDAEPSQLNLEWHSLVQKRIIIIVLYFSLFLGLILLLKSAMRKPREVLFTPQDIEDCVSILEDLVREYSSTDWSDTPLHTLLTPPLQRNDDVDVDTVRKDEDEANELVVETESSRTVVVEIEAGFPPTFEDDAWRGGEEMIELEGKELNMTVQEVSSPVDLPTQEGDLFEDDAWRDEEKIKQLDVVPEDSSPVAPLTLEHSLFEDEALRTGEEGKELNMVVPEVSSPVDLPTLEGDLFEDDAWRDKEKREKHDVVVPEVSSPVYLPNISHDGYVDDLISETPPFILIREDENVESNSQLDPEINVEGKKVKGGKLQIFVRNLFRGNKIKTNSRKKYCCGCFGIFKK